MSDTIRAVQPQKMARGLKFQIQEVGEGADQLCGYTVTLTVKLICDHKHLCFCLYVKSRFSHETALFYLLLIDNL